MFDDFWFGGCKWGFSIPRFQAQALSMFLDGQNGSLQINLYLLYTVLDLYSYYIVTCAVKVSKYSSQLFQVARFLQEWAERSRFFSKCLPGQNILVTQMCSVKDSLPLGDVWVSITNCRTLPQGAWIHCNYSSTVGLWGRGTMYPHRCLNSKGVLSGTAYHSFGNPWRVQVCNRILQYITYIIYLMQEAQRIP